MKILSSIISRQILINIKTTPTHKYLSVNKIFNLKYTINFIENDTNLIERNVSKYIIIQPRKHKQWGTQYS